MIYEVDHSGKVEDTSKDTIICIASSQDHFAIVLRASTKRRIQRLFREIQHSRHFTIYTFSALISLTLSHFPCHAVLIDNEYDGHCAQIIRIVRSMTMYQKVQIRFGFVGKKSYAHNTAYNIGKKKMVADHIITFEEVVQALKKTEFEKRFKNA